MKASYDDLPDQVIGKAKDIFLDTIGVGLSGSKTRPGKTVIDVIKGLGGNPQSTIIGDGSKVNCVQAGFVNTYLVGVMDYEDTYLGLCHPNASVVPSSIAVSECIKGSGKDVLNAIVVGNEVAIRIVLAILPSKEKTKQGGSAYTWHCFGSVASAWSLKSI